MPAAVKYDTISENRVVLKADNITIQAIFNELQSLTHYNFNYGIDIINNKSTYSIDYNDATLNNVLSDLSKKIGFTYVIEQNNVLIKTPKSVSIQQQAVKGVIIDDYDMPLPGVNVVEKGTKNGVITDFDGNYSISTTTSNPILIFSYIGYKTKEVQVSGQSVIDLKMESEYTALDEVVAIGYAVKKKVNLTGAVSSIDSKVLESRPITNLSQGLQGQLPNVEISFPSGRPDETGEFNIRGLGSINGGSPLILIDGTPGNINTLNPRDIANVSVLKDAAASSIYGARGAFGVVLITTKKGKEDGLNITYDSMFGFSSPTRIPKLYLDDPVKYAEIHQQAGNSFSDAQMDYIKARANDPSLPEIVASVNDAGQPYWLTAGNTNWYDLMYQDNAPMNIQNVGVSGESGKFNYYLSGGLLNQEGVYKIGTDDYKRYNLRTKITIDLASWLSVTTNTEFANGVYDQPNPYFRYNLNVERMMSQEANPYNVLQTPDGYWTNHGVVLGFMQDGGRQVEDQKLFKTTLAFDMSFLNNDLKIHGDYTYQNDNTLLTAKRISPLYSPSPGIVEEFPIDDPNSLKRGTTDNDFNVINLHATYSKTLGKHDFSAMLGYNQEEYSNSYYEVLRAGQLSDDYSSLNLSTGTIKTYDKESEYALRGAFYRVNYNFNDRYLIELNGRYDLSSRFPTDDRGGFFPSISAGWRISEENFFKNANLGIKNLKLRASYGALGNQNVNDYLYISNLSVNNSTWLFDDSIQPYAGAPSPISSNITWEQIKSSNFGLDLSTFNGRLTANFDYFIRNTYDMLIPGGSLPSIYGATVPMQNSGDLNTKGWEVSVGWRDNFMLAEKDFSYFVNVNVGDAKSEITSFNSNATKSLGSWTDPDFYEGMVVGEIWGYTTDGYFQNDGEVNAAPDHQQVYPDFAPAPGDIKFVDTNGDGVIDKGQNTFDDHGDLSVIGNSTPRYNYGFGLGFNWNNIDFSVFFQGVGERDFMPNNEAALYYGFYNRKYQPIFEHMTDYWTADNPDAAFPNPRGYIAGAWKDQPLSVNQTGQIQDASYLRWKNLTIGYTFKRDVMKFLESFRLYVSAENIMEWTALSEAFDPEALGDDPYSPGLDGQGMVYPLNRKVTLGLQLNF
ncbi:TonB-dependent receptor [Formosa agariphila KMM 3901]|uniref:TonB-dependent receptor n=1 Tax=Formosa agariphila (strain DSM 15362 / KCTC 12365 / LMG 23005 / KMM 3901 / M-2Alg 35-1) TaxID=1347342 RepID=T2KPN8_FORAG|nr:TonB-dependent receptor [Formosa agariphila]CDF80792.1 TonB-dependent receptor [Formosa agariphila KMM 3901]